MNGAIAWFARNHVAANCLMLAIIGVGLVSIIRMKIEIFPETSTDIVTVRVPYPGAAPEEVEDGIVLRVEEAIQDLQGMKRITSTASEGYSLVTVEVRTGYSTRDLLDDIKVRVDAIDTFPEEAEKPVIEELVIRTQVLSVAIVGEIDETSMRQLADRIREDMIAYDPPPEPGFFNGIQRIFRGPPSITQASVASVRPYEISIEISERDLRRYGLTFTDVANAVRNSSLDLPGGTIRSERGEILLRTKAQAYYGPEFERLVLITNPDGTYVTVGDIAEVKDGFEENPLSSRFDNQRAALVNVFRVGNENALDVANLAHRFVKDYQSRLPEGVHLEIWKDDSIYLDERVTLLLRNALSGLLLVFITLALFLRFNLAFWVTLGIPLSFLGAFAVMSVLGVSINMISLFALILVLGIVVDDAIVVGESVYTTSQREGSGLHAAIKGAQSVAIPVTFAVLTSIAAFTPMLNIPGVAGKIWGVIPMTVIPCLIFSMIESKFVLPAHLSHLRTENSNAPLKGISGAWRWIRRKFSNALDGFVKHVYRPWVFLATRYRYLTVAVFIALYMITMGTISSGWLKFVFFPRVPADFVIAKLEMPFGTPSEVTAEAVGQMEQAAQQLMTELKDKGYGTNNISHILATVGDQPFVEAFDVKISSAQTHLGEVTVELAPATYRNENVTSALVEERWRELTGNIPGAVELSFTSKLAQSGEPINIALSGTDFKDLNQAKEELKERLASFNGVIDITDDFRQGKEEIKFQIKPSAEVLGLSLSDLALQVRQAFYGEEAQRIQRGRDEIKVFVRYPEKDRKTEAGLENMRIRTPEGDEVPFSAVAIGEAGRGYASINRLDRRRSITIKADVDTNVANAGEINTVLANEFLPELSRKHPGVTYSFEGEAREQRETLGGLLTGAILAGMAIYALMAIPFRSYLQPIILMSVIPFSLIGASLGHVIMGIPLSMLSVCGIIALAGVVVNDGLVLVDYINSRRRKGLPIRQAVLIAGRARFRAILLTSLTTFFGLLPLLAERSTQAQFLKPMAVSLAYGVMFATMLNLILVPCLYIILEDIKRLVYRVFSWFKS
ncbi:MAG: efflux RND transporter permease subunit [Verrucomicrobiota bacterium]